MTLADAASRLGLSYSGFYRYVRDGLAHTQDDNGVITVAESTVERLAEKLGDRKRTGKRGRPRNETKPRAICVRVPPDVYARFEAAIDSSFEGDEDPPTVAEWLASLGVRAAGRAGA